MILPPPSHGLQLHIAAFPVAQGTETQHCYYFKLPSDVDVDVTRFEIAYREGSHHMNLFRTLKDFVTFAQRNPGKLTYSSGGNGSAAHIAMEALKLHAKMSLVHIPYRGTGPSITDLLAGNVDATFTGVTIVGPHVRAGRLRALAVSSARRIPSLPDVPTVAESGYPGFEADQWYGLVAPAGTPAARIQQLNTALNGVLAQPAVARQLATEGALPLAGSPQAFRALIEKELPRWGAVVKAANVKAG